MSTGSKARAWVEVSAEALRENFRLVQGRVGSEARIIPMVKADAYGLGMAETVSALGPLGPWGYGVATVEEEGIRLRDLGVHGPVVVLSPLPPESYRPAVEAGLSVSVGDTRALAALGTAVLASGREGRFHLEVDTGMGRGGFDWHRVREWGPQVGSLLGPKLVWEGCFTHFHSADVGDDSPTAEQWTRLRDTLGELPSVPDEVLVHACNSPGALRRPDFRGDAIRPGIFLYGGVAGEGLPRPLAVASLKARVVFLRDAVAGSTTGYGATYSAQVPERWASVAIGYGDGLPRLLGNKGHALVRGRKVPIIGRVSMDVTVLDVSAVPGVELGDVVTFFGRDGDVEVSLEEVAAHAQTINYEILTGLTQRLPRIWTDHAGY